MRALLTAKLALLALSSAPVRSAPVPPIPVARLVSHHAAYRDCTRRRLPHALPTPELDSCANIMVTWPMVVGKPRIETHLQAHLFSIISGGSSHRLAPGDMQARLKNELLAHEGFSQQSFTLQAVVNRRGILTVQNQWYYDGGGAHPDKGMVYYTYELARDRALTLDDLLIVGYQSRLRQMARKALAQQYSGNKLLNSASELTLTSNFLLTSHGLRLHYNAGQLGAVAAGPVDILLSKQQLSPLLRPDSPAQAFWKL